MHCLLTKVEEVLGKVNKRGFPIPSVIQLLIYLWFYGIASLQVKYKINEKLTKN